MIEQRKPKKMQRTLLRKRPARSDGDSSHRRIRQAHLHEEGLEDTEGCPPCDGGKCHGSPKILSLGLVPSEVFGVGLEGPNTF